MKDLRLFPLSEIRPTQMEIGMTHVEFSRTKILRIPDLYESILSRILPGVIGPDGMAYITDGHHWASAANTFANEFPALRETLRVRVDVVADFTGKTWEAFARYLYDNKKGYFTRETRAKFEVLGKDGVRHVPDDLLDDLYRSGLPKNLSELHDSPARSAIGLALEELEVSAEEDLVDYVEFILEEDLEGAFKSYGLDFAALPDSSRVTRDVIERTKRFFATTPEGKSALLHHIRSDSAPGAADRISAALQKYT